MKNSLKINKIQEIELGCSNRKIIISMEVCKANLLYRQNHISYLIQNVYEKTLINSHRFPKAAHADELFYIFSDKITA